MLELVLLFILYIYIISLIKTIKLWHVDEAAEAEKEDLIKNDPRKSKVI